MNEQSLTSKGFKVRKFSVRYLHSGNESFSFLSFQTLDHDFQHPPASAKEGALWVKDERCGLIADKLVVGM